MRHCPLTCRASAWSYGNRRSGSGLSWGSNPPKNSRLERLTPMDRKPIGTGRRSQLPRHHFLKHRGRSPDPSKTHPARAMVARLAGQIRYVTKYNGGSGGDQAGNTAAPWRGARPFDGRPGASRLLGGRCRAMCPRCRRAGYTAYCALIYSKHR
jgi:hypothetical protein